MRRLNRQSGNFFESSKSKSIAGKQLQESIEASEAAWRSKIETVWTITGSSNQKATESTNEMKEISEPAEQECKTNRAFELD